MLKALSRKHAYQKHDATVGYLALLRELLRSTLIPSYNHIASTDPKRLQKITKLHRLNRAFTATPLFSSLCEALDIDPGRVLQSVFRHNPLSRTAVKRLSLLKPVN